FDSHLPVSPFSSHQLLPKDDSQIPVTVYNLQGLLIGKYQNEAEAISNLRKGIYIINHRKIKIE
ncbi:MAG: hypothetical protein K2H05_02965, partial [Duncaniella sp.]|nr:hypothetical protein [Duncaniella sp.]